MTQISIDLAPRSDGARYRRVTLLLEDDGSVTLRSHEMGAELAAPWLDDDEVTLALPRTGSRAWRWPLRRRS